MQPDDPEAKWSVTHADISTMGKTDARAFPLHKEFDFSYRGVDYRGQGFGKAILFTRVGDWGNMQETSW